MATSSSETGNPVAANRSELVLHSYRRCPFAIRVRMVLEEKELHYFVREESLSDPSPDLLAMHPEGKVPLLIHNRVALPESAIITEYLEETFPEPKLMPSTSVARAEMRLWTLWCHQYFKPDLDLYKYKFEQLANDEQLKLIARLRTHIGKIETALKNSEYLLENKFSLADIHIFPFYRQLTKARTTFFEEFAPTIANTWLERIQNRPSFERVMKKPSSA